MALSLHINNTKKAPYFDGTNYAYWKVKMTAHLKSINREVWKVTETKFEVANENAPTPVEEKKLQCNDIAISALHEALDDKTFEQIKNIEVAHDAWAKLEETFEGTKGTKTAKAYILQEKFSSFKMQEDESVPEMFHRLQVIVNELKALGEEVKDSQFSMKFLRSLPKRFDTLITVLVKTTLSESTPQQVFQEVMTDDAYREDDEKDELIKKKKKDGEKKDDEKKKSVAFKASTSKGKAKQESSSEEEASSCDSDEDEEMALLVKRFGKFMKKKGYRARRKKSSSKKNDHSMRCFRCHSKDHLIAKCPYDSDDEDAIKKERKKQKKKQEKKEGSNKKKGDAHVATWDSDDSSSDDESTKKKAHASIAIQGKSSIFDTPSCFMAKATKVSSDDESDHASDSDSDDDEPTKDELITMLEDCTHHYKETRKECKALLKDKKTLEQELDELRASYESLKEDHKKLQKAHTKLEEAHSSLVNKCENEPTKIEKAQTCNIGITCDILSKPIVIASTNPSCSTSTSSSSSSDGFTCDTTLKVENEILKKEVKELNHTLAKAYGGEDRLLMCLGSQRASLYKEGLGYNPKKGKAAFAPHKTSFVKNNGRYCKACKQVGHLEQQCMNKKPKAYVSSIKLNSFYVLTKDTKGVHAKFIGAPWMGSKKKAIWVPKSLVANLGGPNQVWVPKKN